MAVARCTGSSGSLSSVVSCWYCAINSAEASNTLATRTGSHVMAPATPALYADMSLAVIAQLTSLVQPRNALQVLVSVAAFLEVLNDVDGCC
jgi:hypothetical protein